MSTQKIQASLKNSKSDRIPKNVPALLSETVTAARIDLTIPLARRKPPTQAPDRDISSRMPCQHKTFKHAQRTRQTQVITNYLAFKLQSLTKERWAPAGHQQIAHGLGYLPDHALTEPPWV